MIAEELRALRIPEQQLDPALAAGDREYKHGDAEHRGDHCPEHPHEVEEAELEGHAHDPCEHRSRAGESP
jgi:hypothetical protein